MTTIFFGSDKFVLPILEVLNKNFDLSLVLTTEHDPNGPVTSFAKKHNIKLLDIQQFNNETIQQLNNIHASFAVLAYFGLILPKRVLDIFPKGIINIHPSLLPKYRGPTPGQAAILAGDQTTGVTIIKLDEEVDHGPILAQEKAEIRSDDTAESLYERLFALGANMCSRVLIHYNKDEIRPTPQDHSKATFTEHLTRNSGYIDPSSLKIENFKLKIDRMIRAYVPWPGVWTRLEFGEKQKVIKLLPSTSHPEPCLAGRQVDSGSHTFLLQVEGKKPMSYKDFINGYPHVQKNIFDLLQSDLTTF